MKYIVDFARQRIVLILCLGLKGAVLVLEQRLTHCRATNKTTAGTITDLQYVGDDSQFSFYFIRKPGVNHK